LTNDPFLNLTSDSVLGHKQYCEGGVAEADRLAAKLKSGTCRGALALLLAADAAT
jgi:hypothetical protein